jgi:hypothetical protein
MITQISISIIILLFVSSVISSASGSIDIIEQLNNARKAINSSSENITQFQLPYGFDNDIMRQLENAREATREAITSNN